VSAVVVDNEGIVYLTGQAGPEVDFGGGPLNGSGGYVVSLTADGDYRWGRILEGTSWGSDLEVTQTGGVVVTGNFRGTLDLGGEMYDAGSRDMGYLVALTQQGDYVWDRVFGGGSINTGNGVAVGPDDGVILVGSFMAVADFGGGEREADGSSRDMFVAAYDADGEYQWDVHPSGSATEIPIDLAVDSTGSSTVTGHFNGTVDFGGGARVVDDFQGAFVVQLDEDGEYQWDWTDDFEGNGRGHAVAVDEAGNVFATGEFTGSLDFADGAHPSTSEIRGYLLGFDEHGDEGWANVYSSTGHVRPFGVGVDADQRVLLSGHFSEEAVFGPAPSQSAGGDDVFALMLSGAGEHVWDRTWGGPEDEEARAIVRGCTGTIYVGGRDPGNDTGNLVSMDALLLAFD
jgi:hypothetical protein